MQLYSKEEIHKRVRAFLTQDPGGVLVVLGATGCGKTGFSVELCHWLRRELGRDAEVLSVDSRQVYRGLDISAATVTPTQMQGVPHHGIHLCDPNQSLNAYQFQQYGFGVISDIQGRGAVPVLAGGTMLLLDAITQNYVFADKGKKSVRKGCPRWPVLQIGLAWERAALYARLDARAAAQWGGGMVAEIQQLLETHPDMTHSAETSFGVREVQQFLAGELSEKQAIAANQQRNRNYAKRQLTWWRGRGDVLWMGMV